MTDLTPDTKQALCATVRHWRDRDLEDFAAVERGRTGEIALLLEPESEAELAALVLALRAHRVQTATIAGQSGLGGAAWPTQQCGLRNPPVPPGRMGSRIPPAHPRLLDRRQLVVLASWRLERQKRCLGCPYRRSERH